MTDAEAPGSLEGRVVVVTGGARGQGRCHAVAAAAAGAHVVVWDVPAPMRSVAYPLGTAEDLAETVRLAETSGQRCLPMEVDVRDPGAVNAAVAATVEHFGRIDALVANAGISTLTPIADATDEQWREMVDTNLSGAFHCFRAVLPHMRARQYGRIVATASMGGRMGIPNIGHYNATKWGVIGLAKSLALEVAREGITVNVVAPCTVRTPMVENGATFALFSPDSDEMSEIVERFRRVNPIPEPWLEPEDVTREVMHLLTDRGVITGSVVEIALGGSARLH
jgi:SDR family mycofactocin-dependent oxidoreductase